MIRAVPDIKCRAASSDNPTVNDNPGINTMMLERMTMGILILGSNIDIAEASNDADSAARGSSKSAIRRDFSAQRTKPKITQPKMADQKTSCQLVCINMAKAPLEAPKAKKDRNVPYGAGLFLTSAKRSIASAKVR